MLPRQCVYCGMEPSYFLEYGRWGCMHCPNFFVQTKEYNMLVERGVSIWPSKDLPTTKDLKLLEKILNQHTIMNSFFNTNSNSHSSLWVSFRYRIARNIKNSIFSELNKDSTNQSHKTNPDFIFLQEKWKLLSQLPGFQLVFGDEDEIRLEAKKKVLLAEINPQTISQAIYGFFSWFYKPEYQPFYQFLWNRNIFSYIYGIGFINSCPTNCGRGDRFSVLIPFTENTDILKKEWTVLWSKAGFSLELLREKEGTFWKISIKNFQLQRKFYFQRILVPLIVKHRGLRLVQNTSSNK